MTADILDNLGGAESRNREVSAMAAKDGPIGDAKLAEIREAVAAYVKRRGYPLGLVAQKVGSNATYISNFLSGKFDAIPAATLTKLARELNEWTEQDHRRATRSTGQPAFVHTRVAKRLLNVAMRVAETGDIGIAHGPAGVGKSATCAELRRTIVGSLYCYVTPDAARKTGFLRMLYEAVWEHRGPARPTLADLIERLKHSDRLLIIDNADLLEASTYPVLMSLHDVAQVPILLVGTHALVAKLAYDADPLRGQMASRIGLRAELLSEQTAPRSRGRAAEWIGADELRAMFESPRVKLHASAIPRIKQIANFETGRCRRVERMVRYAVSLAGGRGAVLVTEALLLQAIMLVDGVEAAPLAEPAGERIGVAAG